MISWSSKSELKRVFQSFEVLQFNFWKRYFPYLPHKQMSFVIYNIDSIWFDMVVCFTLSNSHNMYFHIVGLQVENIWRCLKSLVVSRKLPRWLPVTFPTWWALQKNTVRLSIRSNVFRWARFVIQTTGRKFLLRTVGRNRRPMICCADSAPFKRKIVSFWEVFFVEIRYFPHIFRRHIVAICSKSILCHRSR